VALCDTYNSQNKDGRITKEEKDQKQDIKPAIIVDCKVICFNCLNICLTKLIQMIKGRRIPHYIIESRNLFNSKMTKTMSTEIVDVLS
jgi:hypothetical protein